MLEYALEVTTVKDVVYVLLIPQFHTIILFSNIDSVHAVHPCLRSTKRKGLACGDQDKPPTPCPNLSLGQ